MPSNQKLNNSQLAHYEQIGVISILIFGIFALVTGFIISFITSVFKLKNLLLFNNQNVVWVIFSVIIFLGFNFSLYYAEYLLKNRLNSLTGLNSKASVYGLFFVVFCLIYIYYLTFPRYIVFLYNTFWI